MTTHDALEDLRERSLRHAEKATILTAKAEAHRMLADTFGKQADVFDPDEDTLEGTYARLVDVIRRNAPENNATVIMEPWGSDGAALIHPGYIDLLTAAIASVVEVSNLKDNAEAVELLREGPLHLLRRTQHMMLPAEGDHAEDGEGPWNLQPYTVFWLGEWSEIPPNVEDLMHGHGLEA